MEVIEGRHVGLMVGAYAATSNGDMMMKGVHYFTLLSYSRPKSDASNEYEMILYSQISQSDTSIVRQFIV